MYHLPATTATIPLDHTSTASGPPVLGVPCLPHTPSTVPTQPHSVSSILWGCATLVELSKHQKAYLTLAEHLTRRNTEILNTFAKCAPKLENLQPGVECRAQITAALKTFGQCGDVSPFVRLHKQYVGVERECCSESLDMLSRLDACSLLKNESKQWVIENLTLEPSSINLLYVDTIAVLALSAHNTIGLFIKGSIVSQQYNALVASLEFYDAIKLSSAERIKGHALAWAAWMISEVGSQSDTKFDPIHAFNNELSSHCLAQAFHSYQNNDPYNPTYWANNNQAMPEDTIRSMFLFDMSRAVLCTHVSGEDLNKILGDTEDKLYKRFSNKRDTWYQLPNKQEALIILKATTELLLSLCCPEVRQPANPSRLLAARNSMP